MIPFLKQVAQRYYAQGELGQAVFIFPNRRSLAFFRKHLCDLAAADSVTMLAPRLTTIGDFFSTMSGAGVSDRISLLLELYEVYRRLNPKAEPLDDFIYWGDVLIADFDDIDKYRVDAKMLLRNIADLKAVKDGFEYADPRQKEAIDRLVRNFDTVVRSGNARRDVKDNFRQIWDILYPLYTQFREVLSEKGMAYEGKIYRDLADRLADTPVVDVLSAVFPGVDKCVFVGLNALNECEKAVLSKLRDAGIGEFCWDFAGPFIADDSNVCSLFRKENLEMFPPVFTPVAESSKPVIHICKIPSATGQARMLPGILSKVPQGERGVDFAIVLADETMLMPVLGSLPGLEDGVNVTMGCPMQSSEWCSLMKDIVAMQMRMRSKDGEWYFYHKSFHDVVSSAVIQALLSEEEKKTVADIFGAAKYYIPQADIATGPVLSEIFRPVVTSPGSNDAAQTDALADYLLGVCSALATLLRGSEDSNTVLQLDFAKRYYQAVTRLRGLHLGLLPRTWVHLLEQILSGISVPFEGEPLGGLQVMGPLETRALDFKHIVILNANEGVFPRISARSSFIPAEIRLAFGLPTYIRQDAVWAYYFYRMITRAEDVWLLYDSRTEGLNTGEESRFAKQLRYLYPDKCIIEEAVATADISQSADAEELKKTQEDVEAIATRTFSATALETYVGCQAQFYYRYVKKLKPEGEVKETLDPGLEGTVCHETLREIYAEGGPVIATEYLKAWLGRKDEIKRRVLYHIGRYLKSIEVGGQDLVTANILVRFITRVMECDIRQIEANGPLRILGLECPMSVEICGHRFSGVIDRIDSFRDGMVRVVDYKTGSDKQDVLLLSKPDDAFKSENKAALQFFIYDRMIEAGKEFSGKFICNSMYAMRSFFTEEVKTVPADKAFAEGLEQALALTFADMEDISKPFERTSQVRRCDYCDYRELCGRSK